MYTCVKNNVDFVLAGSIRDDGPLPDVITDAVEAQKAMRAKLEGVTIAMMMGTMLHSIAVGNLLPATVKTLCVDINPGVVTKLTDRGSFSGGRFGHGHRAFPARVDRFHRGRSLGNDLMRDLLLCPPDYYGIEYEINPWMSRARGADTPLVQAQWRGLHEKLVSLGCNVHLVPPKPKLPDMVFTANAGLTVGKRFIPSNFRHKERAAEAPLFADWMEEARLRNCLVAGRSVF